LKTDKVVKIAKLSGRKNFVARTENLTPVKRSKNGNDMSKLRAARAREF